MTVPRWIWWFYFAVMTLNVAWLPVSAPYEANSWIYAAIGGLALVGLAGYIANRRYGPSGLWKLVFVALLAVCVASAMMAVINRRSNLLFGGIAFAALVMFPWLFALWRYAFPRARDISTG